MPPGKRQARSSGKKQVAKQSALLLRALTDQASFSQDLLLQLLQADQPACSIYTSGHTNRKDNPNCFCGLIPKPGSSKKKGLWQAKPSVVSALGSDPNDIRRSAPSDPCGLANLGNTCYVNSALQCLFMIHEFRDALYRVEEPLASAPIVAELRELFAHLQWGPRSYVDPAAFARALNLETHVQQDGQEFMKLLLSKLESLFKQSQQQEVREVVPALFKGAYRFVTECKVCGQESQSSANLIDFYELPLQVQRYSSVAESLSSFLAAELLEGDNQYFCEGCLAKVDASRQTVLHQLPPYLCLALQRFMFNFETMTKQKAMNKLSFPLKLDLGAFMPNSAGSTDHLYELVAVQVHKGNSASHGHYVAHVRDSKEVWWRFDDTEVTKLGSTPASHTGDHGSTNAASSSSTPDKQKDAITSSNAYMLLYKRSGWQYEGAGVLAAVDEERSEEADIPAGVVGMVATCREEFNAACRQYEATKEGAEKLITDRQQFVREVLESAAVTDHQEERCCWINTAWLETWANSEVDCEPIDNAPLLCQHHKLDSGKVSAMKCIKEGAWLRLKEKYKGGPQLTTQDVCTLCLDNKKQGAHDAQLAQQIREELDRLDKVDKKKEEDSDELQDADAEGYYVSATWLRGWRRSKNVMAPQPPTAALTCPHGRLSPEASSSSARRAVVSPTVWNGLMYLWRKYVEGQTRTSAVADKDKSKGGAANGHSHEVVELTSDASDVEILPSPSSGPSADQLSPELLEFPLLSSVECEQCAASLGIAKEEHTRSKMEMADARKELANLAAAVQLTLQPEERYYLVPSAWLAAWRARVNAPKRTTVGAPSALAPLCPVSEALAALLCPCHSNPHRLAAELPVLEVSRNSRCCQPRPTSDDMTLISAEDWKSLWEFCLLHTTPSDTSEVEAEQQKSRVAAVEAGVQAWFTVPDQQESEKDDRGDNGAQGAGSSSKTGRSNGEGAASTSKPVSKEVKNVVLLTNPPVCAEWKAAQEAARKCAALNYKQRDIIVQMVTQDELPSLTALKGERRSKRSRRGRTVLQLDSTCTLQQLKLHIFQHLGIHPINADVYIRGVLAQGEELSLAQLEVFPEEELMVAHAGRTSDDDYASLVGSGTGSKAREVEMGFKNTALAETPTTLPDPPPAATPAATPAQHNPPITAADPTCHVSQPTEQQQSIHGAGSAPAPTSIHDTPLQPEQGLQNAHTSPPEGVDNAPVRSHPSINPSAASPHEEGPAHPSIIQGDKPHPAHPTTTTTPMTAGQKRKAPHVATGDDGDADYNLDLLESGEKKWSEQGGDGRVTAVDLASPTCNSQGVKHAAKGGDLPCKVDLVSATCSPQRVTEDQSGADQPCQVDLVSATCSPQKVTEDQSGADQPCKVDLISATCSPQRVTEDQSGADQPCKEDLVSPTHNCGTKAASADVAQPCGQELV